MTKLCQNGHVGGSGPLYKSVKNPIFGDFWHFWGQKWPFWDFRYFRKSGLGPTYDKIDRMTQNSKKRDFGLPGQKVTPENPVFNFLRIYDPLPMLGIDKPLWEDR